MKKFLLFLIGIYLIGPVYADSNSGHSASEGVLLAQANNKNLDGELFNAIEGGDTDKIRSLLQQGANVNGVYTDGHVGSYTALMSAVRKDSMSIVRLLLEKGADINMIHGRDVPPPPLSLAVRNKNVDMILFLLEKGAEINPKNNDAQDPLSEAARNGDMDIVHLLLAKGAEVNPKNNHGYTTALMKGAHNGNADIVRLLLEKGAE